jgi:hypothetical protein
VLFQPIDTSYRGSRATSGEKGDDVCPGCLNKVTECLFRGQHCPPADKYLVTLKQGESGLIWVRPENKEPVSIEMGMCGKALRYIIILEMMLWPILCCLRDLMNERYS